MEMVLKMKKTFATQLLRARLYIPMVAQIVKGILIMMGFLMLKTNAQTLQLENNQMSKVAQTAKKTAIQMV